MEYDFDRKIDRAGSGALKYDALQERFGRPDLLPMWVADMDFATPDFIIDALRQRLEHPVMGYTIEPADYRPSIIDWLRELHGVEVDPSWLTFIPGIVKGIGMVVNLFTAPGDGVIIMPPVYYPFRIVPEENSRRVLYNPLIEQPDGRYAPDFEGLERLASDPGSKLLILSSPHNPAGIAWTRPQLERIAEICARHGVLVVADEIHSEMMLWGGGHVPFYTVSDAARANSITFAAPSKTFNIAGIVSSYAIVPDAELRERFFSYLKANELDEPTLFSPIATIAAYRHGHEWRRRMLAYVEGNIRFIEEFCSRHLPGIKALRPDASFLVWLDCRRLGLSHDELCSFFCDDCHLALNDGEMFGPGGEGFMRLNAAAPREVVAEGLRRIEAALSRR